MSVPIRYVAAAAAYPGTRPSVIFSAAAVAPRGTVRVAASGAGGWVFDINLSGEGACAAAALEVTGGSVAYLSGFSGDDSRVEFAVTHDGAAAEIVVVYNTRPD